MASFQLGLPYTLALWWVSFFKSGCSQTLTKQAQLGSQLTQTQTDTSSVLLALYCPKSATWWEGPGLCWQESLALRVESGSGSS